MDLRASFWSAVEWLRALGQNRYFWSGMAVLFAIGLGAYLLLDAVIMPSYTRHDASIQVPSVEDLPFEEADSLLRARDLRVERQVGRYNPNVEQNVVVDQMPLSGSDVKPDRRVYLTVNSGEIPMVKIPDLNGMSVREAKNRLSSLGFEVGAVQEDSIPSPYANTITKQDPSPGDSTKKGNTVNLWYSTGLGENEVDVPNVTGYSVKDARESLRRYELRSVVVDTDLDPEQEEAQQRGTVDRDSLESEIYVVDQGSPPGSAVQAGTEIRLFTTTDSTEAAEQREALEDTTDSSN